MSERPQDFGCFQCSNLTGLIRPLRACGFVACGSAIAPVIIACPWAASAGTTSTALIEAVDIFPTLATLSGLPFPEGVQGSDFSGLLLGQPEKYTKKYAFSQFAKKYQFSKELQQKEAWNVCVTCNRSDIDVQGYSIRSETHRYTEWLVWNKTSLRPEWGAVEGVELYDHTGDFGADFDRSAPTSNLWRGAENTSASLVKLVGVLPTALRKQFQGDHLPPQLQLETPEAVVP